MQISNPSIWELQGILSSILGPFYRWFLYKYQPIFQANADHIEIAFEELDKEINIICEELLMSYKKEFNVNAGILDTFALQVKNDDFIDKLSSSEFIGPLLSIHLFQDQTFIKLKWRMERSMNAFLRAYQDSYLQYERWIPNWHLLVTREKDKLIDMSKKSYIDLESFLEAKFIKFLQNISTNPSPNNGFLIMDIENVYKQLEYVRKQNIWDKLVASFDRFLDKIIDLVKI